MCPRLSFEQARAHSCKANCLFDNAPLPLDASSMSSATRNSFHILEHARIVLPDGVVENSALLIEESRIASVSLSETERPAPAATNNLTGLTLYPGMVDVHIHGAVGVDTVSYTHL